ncbi:DUF4245 domain-containing protein [Nesterenkonia sp. NBAIMH1]|uniref:DUF4245 domain-containing protein n=2 Tax=Nesterenkonia TaxID=57494 RepID=UPI00143D6728|nr:DUF4245 domain-containing protein [Nesterenkonia sp. NBAIMH1]
MTDRPEQNPESGPHHEAEPDARAEHESEEELPTPQLTEAQHKRLTTPMFGMLMTMLVLVLIMGGFYFLSPEPDYTFIPDEDVEGEAAALDDAGVTAYSPLSPAVPDDWTANYARWESRVDHGVDVWEVGYTTTAMNFVGFAQTEDPQPSWLAEEIDHSPAAGEQSAAGMTFELYHDGDQERRYWVLTEENNDVDGTTVVIGGDAGDDEFLTAVEAVVESLREDPENV